MRPAGFILLVAWAAALVGCSKPVLSTGYLDKDKLMEDLIVAVKSGDKTKVSSMIFKTGLSSEDLILNQGPYLDMLLGTRLKDTEVKNIHFAPPAPKQLQPVDYKGRLVSYAFQVEEVATIYIANDSSKLKLVLTLPILNRAGLFWLCPASYVAAAPATQSEPPKIAPIDPSLPYGKELSKSPEISIVLLREEETNGLRLNYSYSNDAQGSRLITSIESQSCDLQKAITATAPKGEWFIGLDKLPEGTFKIIVRNLPMTEASVHQVIVKAFAASFGLQISEEDLTWDGHQVVVPENLPAVFHKSSASPADGSSGTSYDGYYFKGCSLGEIRTWLEHALKTPIEIIDGHGETKFDFEITLWPEADSEIKGLRNLGFKIEPKKLTRKTTVITRK